MNARTALDLDPTAASAARRAVRQRLAAWALDDLIEDAQLIVSELVTNALRHGRGPLELRLRTDGRRLHVEVRDGAGDFLPQPRHAPDQAVDGRGLRLVAAMADDWGWERSAEGKSVWAELTA